MTAASPLHRLGLAQWAAVWATLATLSACWLLTAEAAQSGGARWDRSVAIHLGSLLLWALLSVPLVRVARGLPLHGEAPSRRRTALGLFARLLLVAAFALAHGVLLTAVLATTLPLELGPDSYRLLLTHTLRHNLHFDALIAALVVFADESLGWYRRFEQRRVETARLAEQIATERLAAARLRLRPSFVFRALDAIGVEIPRDPARAERMVLQLAALLRTLLESGGDGDASAREELEFARTYLEVERGRLGDRLTWSLDAGPDALAFELPRLTLQPLLEAAVEAAGWGAGPARVELRLTRLPAGIRLEVVARRETDPEALDPAILRDALAAVRARLERRFDSPPLRAYCESGAAGEVLAILEFDAVDGASSRVASAARTGEEVLWSRS